MTDQVFYAYTDEEELVRPRKRLGNTSGDLRQKNDKALHSSFQYESPAMNHASLIGKVGSFSPVHEKR